jgi:hypothetical protein
MATTPANDWLQGLADIEWPAAPDWSAFYMTAAAAAVLLCVGIAAIVWYRRRPVRPVDRSGQALARLAALQAAWQGGTTDDRAAAYQLMTILRLGLGQAQLTTDHPAPAQVSATTWQTTIAMLHRYRYAGTTPEALPVTCFDNVRRWLQLAATDGMRP